jgi:hypothetical protein
MQQPQKRGALNGIPSANLQMCGFLKELISAGRKVFFCFFFFGVLECVVIIMLQFRKKKPNR